MNWLHLFFLTALSKCSAFLVRYKGCTVERGLEKEALREQFDQGASEDEENASPDLSERRGPFRSLAGQTETMTVQVCVERCWLQNFEYAAMQGGTRCYCSMSMDGLTTLNDTACTERCSGNCKQRCGAAISMSVYETGYEQRVTDARTADYLKTSYLGCYFDTFANRLCDKSSFSWKEKQPMVSGRLTPVLCAMYCASSPAPREVAVLKSPNSCCCGSSFRTADGIDRDRRGVLCTIPCIGDEENPTDALKCVGIGRVGVYSVRDWRTRPPPGITNADLDNFARKSGMLWPQFPVNNDFEVKEYRPTIEMEQNLPSETKAALESPVIEPENTGVAVIDEPTEKEKSGTSTWVIVAILLCCIIIMGGIVVVLRQRKADTSNELEKAMALLPNQPGASAQPGVDDTEETSKKKKKKKKRMKSSTKDEVTNKQQEWQTEEKEALLPDSLPQ